MPATDLEQRTQEALYSVLSGDGPQGTSGTLMNLCGRATDLAVEWDDLVNTTKPVLAMFFVVDRELGALGDTRDATWQISAVANRRRTCRALLDRVATILTGSALLTAGLDGVVLRRTRRGGSYDERAKEYIAHLDLTIRVTK